MKVAERYKSLWYQKRIDQNKKIKQHLVKIIQANQESDFPWSKTELMFLNYEDLLELAIVSANKKISVTLGSGSDMSNGRDAKFSVVRKCGGKKTPWYSALVPGCENKEHILACVYEGIQRRFYYFSFPATCKQHSIPFDRETGEPKRNGYMWDYECQTFEQMAQS